MYPTSPNKANTGDLSRFVGENTQRIDWHNANLCAVFLIFQSLKRYAKQLFQNRSLMNTPVAESVHAEHHKGDLAAQASVAATDNDVMLQLFLGDFFIKGMRKYTTLFGGTDSEAEFEKADFRFAYPDYPADHLGIDSAYLAADVMNILDNDSHTEDCTTQKQPPKNKKNTQSGSFDMST